MDPVSAKLTWILILTIVHICGGVFLLAVIRQGEKDKRGKRYTFGTLLLYYITWPAVVLAAMVDVINNEAVK